MEFLILALCVVCLPEFVHTSETVIILNKAELTENQRNGAYTVRFNGNDVINYLAANETARKDFLVTFRNEILKFLNKKEENQSSTVSTMTTVTLTTVTTTTIAMTQPSTPPTIPPPTDDVEPDSAKRRRRRRRRASEEMYSHDDVKFIEGDVAKFINNDTLQISLVLDVADPEKLEEALRYIKANHAVLKETKLSIKEYHKGLPKDDDSRGKRKLAIIWGTVLAIVLLIVIIIAIVLCCKINKNSQYRVGHSTPITTFCTVPPLETKREQSTTDHNGFIIPMDQFQPDFIPTTIDTPI